MWRAAIATCYSFGKPRSICLQLPNASLKIGQHSDLPGKVPEAVCQLLTGLALTNLCDDDCPIPWCTSRTRDHRFRSCILVELEAVSSNGPTGSGCALDTFQLAEVAVTRNLFAAILDRIERLALPPPVVARCGA